MRDRPGTERVQGCRTTRRCRSPHHRSGLRRDGSAARTKSWCRLLPCDPPEFLFLCRSGRGKSVQRGVAIGLPWVEPRRGIIRTVRRVGIDLRLQTQRIILAVEAATFSRAGALGGNYPIEVETRL